LITNPKAVSPNIEGMDSEFKFFAFLGRPELIKSDNKKLLQKV